MPFPPIGIYAEPTGKWRPSRVGGLAVLLRLVRLEQGVDLDDPLAFRRALGQALEAAFGP